MVAETIKPGYKQTEIGIIPEDWDVVELNSIAQISSGGTPFRGNLNFWNGKIPWITTTLIDFNVITEAFEFITEKGLRNSATKLYTKGTILMAMYGQGKTRGKVAVLGIDATVNQACAAIDLQKNIDSNYIFMNLSNRYNEIRNLSNTGNQENLNIGLIKGVLVPVPKIKEEQSAIAQALSDTDELIQRLDKLITKKKDIKKGAMQELLTGKKRLPGFSGEWEEEELGVIGEISGAGVDKKNIPGETPVRLVNFLDVYHRDFIRSNMLNHWVTAPTHKVVKCSVKKGDIFFTPSSEMREDIGLSAVAMEDIPDATYSYHVTRFRLFEEWDIKFSTYVFNGRTFLNQCETVCEGSGKRYVINMGKFRGLKIKYPKEKKEQEAIGNILFSMDSEIEQLEAKRDKYNEIKQGMMQQLLTGRIRLKCKK